MAQIFVGRMHRACNVRVVLGDDALRRSAVELLLTRNPMVFEYAISVVALLLAGHGDAGRAAVVAELGKLDAADAAGASVVREHVAARQVRERMTYVYCVVCRCVVCALWCVECSTWRGAR